MVPDMSLLKQTNIAQSAPASLETLPPELLFPIISSLPGLDTLWNLLRASPRAWRFFNDNSIEITEAILTGPNSTTQWKLRRAIRVVAMVRSEVLPFKSFKDFASWIKYDATRLLRRGRALPKAEGLDSLLSVGINVLPSVAATACRISARSQSSLVRDQDRWQFLSYMMRHRGYYGVSETRCSMSPCICAFWVEQLLGEVQSFVREKREMTSWSISDAYQICQMHRNCRFWPAFHFSED